MCGHSDERTLSDFILSYKEYLNHMISDTVRLYAIYVICSPSLCATGTFSTVPSRIYLTF